MQICCCKWIWNYSESVRILEPIAIICITTRFHKDILRCTSRKHLFTKMDGAHIYHIDSAYRIYFCGWLLNILFIAAHSWSDCH